MVFNPPVKEKSDSPVIITLNSSSRAFFQKGTIYPNAELSRCLIRGMRMDEGTKPFPLEEDQGEGQGEVQEEIQDEGQGESQGESQGRRETR